VIEKDNSSKFREGLSSAGGEIAVVVIQEKPFCGEQQSSPTFVRPEIGCSVGADNDHPPRAGALDGL
jgi:hypothetical protein